MKTNGLVVSSRRAHVRIRRSCLMPVQNLSGDYRSIPAQCRIRRFGLTRMIDDSIGDFSIGYYPINLGLFSGIQCASCDARIGYLVARPSVCDADGLFEFPKSALADPAARPARYYDDGCWQSNSISLRFQPTFSRPRARATVSFSWRPNTTPKKSLSMRSTPNARWLAPAA